MRNTARHAVICVAALGALGVNDTGFPQTKPANAGYRVSIEVERLDSRHWEALVDLANAGPIAALTLPLKWGNGHSPFRVDSANYADLRTEYFALKTFRVDSTRQAILIGLIADLGGDSPPLEPGRGTIARLFFSSPSPTTQALTLDTTFVPPFNTLQLVTPDVRAVNPQFERANETTQAPR